MHLSIEVSFKDLNMSVIRAVTTSYSIMQQRCRPALPPCVAQCFKEKMKLIQSLYKHRNTLKRTTFSLDVKPKTPMDRQNNNFFCNK
jgi:hypothetical protein